MLVPTITMPPSSPPRCPGENQGIQALPLNVPPVNKPSFIPRIGSYPAPRTASAASRASSGSRKIVPHPSTSLARVWVLLLVMAKCRWRGNGSLMVGLVADWLRPGPLPAQRPTAQNGYEYVWLYIRMYLCLSQRCRCCDRGTLAQETLSLVPLGCWTWRASRLLCSEMRLCWALPQLPRMSRYSIVCT